LPSLPPAPSRSRRDGDWSIEEAEEALKALEGVISARVVGGPGGKVQEVHLLARESTPAKKLVRRVEATFLTRFHMRIDHRKVSVAHSRWPVGNRDKKAKSSASFLREPTYPVVDRPLLATKPDPAPLNLSGHHIELDPSGQMRVKVVLEAQGREFTGNAKGSQKARSRMTMLASATLRAVEAAFPTSSRRADNLGQLALDDVDVVDAFQRDFVLASVYAMDGLDRASHAGAAAVEDSLDRAVIRSTLQAADRWVRRSLERRDTR